MLDEFINVYYKGFTALMLRVKAKDRIIDTESSLFLLESVTLNVVMKSFVRDLLNDDIQKQTIRELIIINRSLKELCNLAEDANRAKKKFHKLMKEKNKTKELAFYKEIMSRNLSRDRIQAMLTSYKIDVTLTD
jgi:phosphoenolpyruvate carboxylase